MSMPIIAAPGQMNQTDNPVQPDPGNQAGRGGAPHLANTRLIDIYNNYFACLPADTAELLAAAFRLRFQVYCIENRFEDPADNPGGLETDAFDIHSVHSVLIHRKSGATAGTVRMILPGERNLPIHNICDHPDLRDTRLVPYDTTVEISRFAVSKEFRRRHKNGAADALEDFSALPISRISDSVDLQNPDLVPPATTSEISRFAVSKDFRRRLGDNTYADSEELSHEDERRLIPNLTLGLIRSLVDMSAEHGITHWSAAMEPALLRLLTRLGIHFTNAGPLIHYHGRRQPCYAELDGLLTRCRKERPDVWEVLTHEGRTRPAKNGENH